jgi:arginyl-tRNA synthetase
MPRPVKYAKDEIRRLVSDAFQRSVRDGVFPSEARLPDFIVEIPKEKSHGDFSANIALVSSKQLKMPPRKIAEALVKNLDIKDSLVSTIELAGPGFINFKMGHAYYSHILKTISLNAETYGRTEDGEGKKIMVEFVSANPTGPMHMGNARGGALGDALASILDWAGWRVSREFYINDTGNQVEKFYQSLKARYIQLIRGEDACEFPEDGYHGDDIRERAAQFKEKYGEGYVDADDETLRPLLTKFALRLNISAMRETLERYRICFDTWFPESSLYESGDFNETIELLKKRGCTYEKDGALWYKATDFGGEKDEVLIRANGFPTYFASDIAYHRNKFLKRGFDRVIDIWGADHHGHVARIKGAMDAIGLDGERLDVVLMQLVRLTQGGEAVRMSKRTGKAVTLSDLLDETGVDAARFFFNLRQPDSHLEFDLDLAIEQSSNNPVYYVQYAHARIHSLLNHLCEEGFVLNDTANLQYDLLTADEEIELIKALANFPEEISQAATAYDPARITRYCIDLASQFHKFYNVCRIKGEEPSLLMARLGLCNCTRTVLKNALGLLAIEAPERM